METNTGCDPKLIIFSEADNNQGLDRLFPVQHATGQTGVDNTERRKWKSLN